jgi:hypothetical protein
MSQKAQTAARARFKRVVGLAAAMLSCAALAACGTAQAAPKTTSTPQSVNAPAAPVPVVVFVRNSGDMASVRLPIERYLLTPAQNAAINHAMWILSAQCMRERGVDNFTVPAELTGQWAGSEVARRYGPTDLDRARRYGYHDASSAAAQPAQPASTPALTAAERQVLTNCRHEATRELDGGQPLTDQWQGAAEKVDLQSYQSSAHSPQVEAVEAQWSACMAGLGHHYSTPNDAFNDPAWRRSSAASPTEIATAVDDIQCKWKTNLIGVWVSVETRIQDSAIAQQRAELDIEQRAESQQLAATARIEQQSR